MRCVNGCGVPVRCILRLITVHIPLPSCSIPRHLQQMSPAIVKTNGPRRSRSRWNASPRRCHASPQFMRRSEQSILIPALPSCASCPMRARIEILGDANPAREGGCQPPRMRRRRPSFPHPPARSPARSLVARSSFCSPSLPGRMEQSWDTSLWTFAASRSSSLSEFSNMWYTIEEP